MSVSNQRKCPIDMAVGSVWSGKILQLRFPLPWCPTQHSSELSGEFPGYPFKAGQQWQIPLLIIHFRKFQFPFYSQRIILSDVQLRLDSSFLTVLKNAVLLPLALTSGASILPSRWHALSDWKLVSHFQRCIYDVSWHRSLGLSCLDFVRLLEFIGLWGEFGPHLESFQPLKNIFPACCLGPRLCSRNSP